MIDETAEEIADMQTHSSSVVAVKAARALTELVERGYANLDDYERALEFANACGALAAMEEGARTAPSFEDVEAFLDGQF